MQNKPLLLDIAIMRPILIISIILGHAFTMFAGSLAWPLPESVREVAAYKCLNPILISFALQAFVFVSGYLFSYKCANKANSNFNKKEFILGKVKRILIPSAIFSTLYLLLLNPQKFNSILVIYDIVNGAGHLWFLPMLFWCFVLGALFHKMILSSNKIIVFLATLSISFISFLLPDYLRIASGMHYFIYYVLGMLCFLNKDKIYSWIRQKKIVIAILWVVLGCFCFLKVRLANMSYEDIPYLTLIKGANNIILGILGSTTLWMTINSLIRREFKINGKIWFGLYIYHQFIMMWLYYHTALPLYLSAEWLPWIAFILTFVLSYILVVLTLKTKIGNWLIG